MNFAVCGLSCRKRQAKGLYYSAIPLRTQAPRFYARAQAGAGIKTRPAVLRNKEGEHFKQTSSGVTSG